MKKIITYMLCFIFLFVSPSAIASAWDVSINRVSLNDMVISSSKTNLVQDSNLFSVFVEFTPLSEIQHGHVEAILRGKGTNLVISNATGIFNLGNHQDAGVGLNLALFDDMTKETEFELIIKIIDEKGIIKQNSYNLKTDSGIRSSKLDASIDRVFVNQQVVAASRTNFIDKSNRFDIQVDITALEDIENARVEAIVKDLNSGLVVADASPNFNMVQDSSIPEILSVDLIDGMKQSDSFELTIKLANSEGLSIQKIYGLKVKPGISGTGARSLDVSIDSVEIENRVIAEGENNFLVINQGEAKLDLELRLTSLETVDDVHAEAVLYFENGDVVADSTFTFDITEGQNLVKDLDLNLPSPFEQNQFKLKLRIVDPDGNSEEKIYWLKISQKKFPFIISSILVSPEEGVEAGKNMVVKLGIKNAGLMSLSGIKATVSMPGLGISSTRFLDSISVSGQDEGEQEFIMKVLEHAESGQYTVRAGIVSQFGGESEVKDIQINVIGINDQKRPAVNDRLIITIPVLTQDLKNDGSEINYPVILKNEGPDSNSYNLVLNGANWADLRLSGSNLFVIRPGETLTTNILVSTKSTESGEHVFTVTINEGNEMLKDIALKSNIINVTNPRAILLGRLKLILEIAIILTVIALFTTGLVYGIRGMGMEESVEDASFADEIPDARNGESYY